jgi:hypothetical protein
MCEHATDGDLDRGDVAMSTELGDKPPAGLQRAMHARKHRIMVAHPVQYRIRKHGIEFPFERQMLGAYQPRVEAARLRSGDHLV